MVIQVNSSNFEQEVLKSDTPVLVDFFATWCGPCKMQSPIIDQFAKGTASCKVCKLDTDEATEIALKFRVSSIPTIILFNKGEVVDRAVGLQSLAELNAMLSKLQ